MLLLRGVTPLQSFAHVLLLRGVGLSNGITHQSNWHSDYFKGKAWQEKVFTKGFLLLHPLQEFCRAKRDPAQVGWFVGSLFSPSSLSGSSFIPEKRHKVVFGLCLHVWLVLQIEPSCQAGHHLLLLHHLDHVHWDKEENESSDMIVQKKLIMGFFKRHLTVWLDMWTAWTFSFLLSLMTKGTKKIQCHDGDDDVPPDHH